MKERGKQVTRGYNIIVDGLVGAPLYMPFNPRIHRRHRVFWQRPRMEQILVEHRETFLRPPVHSFARLSVPPGPLMREICPVRPKICPIRTEIYPLKPDSCPKACNLSSQALNLTPQT